jgi:hypothetical protein
LATWVVYQFDNRAALCVGSQRRRVSARDPVASSKDTGCSEPDGRDYVCCNDLCGAWLGTIGRARLESLFWRSEEQSSSRALVARDEAVAPEAADGVSRRGNAAYQREPLTRLTCSGWRAARNWAAKRYATELSRPPPGGIPATPGARSEAHLQPETERFRRGSKRLPGSPRPQERTDDEALRVRPKSATRWQPLTDSETHADLTRAPYCKSWGNVSA